ncbi:hypothetical protein ACFQ9Q_37940 [Streptomyces virginiae]
MSDLHVFQASCTSGCHRLTPAPAALIFTALTRTAAARAGLLVAGGTR